jgi:N-acyl homoserine lactone hydrolase
VKLHLLSGGRLRLRRATYFPGSSREETVDVPVPCYLLRHAKGDVLFDTGCNPAAASDPAGTWGGLAKVMQPLHGPEEHVGAGLSALGVRPEDIATVVMTHLHADHAGCNALFRRAEFLVQEAEWQAATAPDAEAQGYIRREWEATGRPMRRITGEHDLFGDGSITLVPLPGHTPGLMGASLRLERDGAFLLAGDAVPMRAVLDADTMPRNTRDPDAARASYAKVREIAAAGATVLCGHDAEQWAGLRKGAEFYA